MLQYLGCKNFQSKRGLSQYPRPPVAVGHQEENQASNWYRQYLREEGEPGDDLSTGLYIGKSLEGSMGRVLQAIDGQSDGNKCPVT